MLTRSDGWCGGDSCALRTLTWCANGAFDDATGWTGAGVNAGTVTRFTTTRLPNSYDVEGFDQIVDLSQVTLTR